MLDDPLLDAARRGELEAVRELIRRGADVDGVRGDGMTALHFAAERGHAEVARALIDAGAAVGAGTRIGRYAPLHLAARGGHGTIVARLLEAGADPNAATTNSGVTTLHLAAGTVNGAATVTALLEHGADPNAREASAGQTPLMFAAAANRAAAVTALLEAGADPDIATAVVDVLPSLALDREANRRFRDMIGGPPETLGQYGPEVDPEAEWAGEPGPAHGPGGHPCAARVPPLRLRRRRCQPALARSHGARLPGRPRPRATPVPRGARQANRRNDCAAARCARGPHGSGDGPPRRRRGH